MLTVLGSITVIVICILGTEQMLWEANIYLQMRIAKLERKSIPDPLTSKGINDIP